MIYTKKEFKKQWENNPDCNITFGDCADCAQAWGIFARPRCYKMELVRYEVLRAANCIDAEEYNPAV